MVVDPKKDDLGHLPPESLTHTLGHLREPHHVGDIKRVSRQNQEDVLTVPVDLEHLPVGVIAQTDIEEDQDVVINELDP